MSSLELAGMHFAQEGERANIENTGASGNPQIMAAVEPVADDVMKLMAKYRPGPKPKALPPASSPAPTPRNPRPWEKYLKKD